MGDFKINEKTVFTQSGSDEPAMGSTITDIPAAGVTGVLPVAVTGGSGLTHAMNGPAFSAYKSVNQTVANDTLTKVLFETEDFDTNNNYDNVTTGSTPGYEASSRFTPTVAGLYVLSAMVIMGVGVYSRIHLHIYKNGETYRRMENKEASSSILDDWSGHGSLLVQANGSGDYFEVWMDQRTNSSADNLSAGSGSYISWFTGHMVRHAV